ncbi:MAG: hypothetical protein HC904_13285 [Blastochloris sp.]|nr:hypothetical protein [Blastochloris sp.]
MAKAYANGEGGVIDFEEGVLSDANAEGVSARMDVRYGREKVLHIERRDGYGMVVASQEAGISALSGVKVLGLGGQITEPIHPIRSNDFVFEFVGIEGGEEGEQVVAFGLTLLSRDNEDWPGTVFAFAQFDDGSSVTVPGLILRRSNGGADIFFGFEAPEGRHLTRAGIDLPNKAKKADGTYDGARTSVDDLVFITAEVKPGPMSNVVDYEGMVRAYADALLTSGRDTYGEQSTPMIASMLDRRTLQLPVHPIRSSLPELSGEGVRYHDRAWDGANVGRDQELYQLLYSLSEKTGEVNYARQADAALEWWMKNTQSEKTGLLAWGEHLGWDFRRETVIEQYLDASLSKKHYENLTHEYSGDWDLWPRVKLLADGPMRRFAQGLWDHQIGDKETGDFSRHAKYHQHEVGTGASFPRHGGYYIAAWAHAWVDAPDMDVETQRFKKTDMLTAINRVVDQFNNRRHPNNDALPAGSNSKSDPQYFTSYWQANDLGLAISAWSVAPLLPPVEAEKLRSLALRSDDVILNKVPNDLVTAGRGFVNLAFVDTLKPGDPRGRSKYAYSSVWDTSYGNPSTAYFGVLTAKRYKQLASDSSQSVRAAGYRNYTLMAADLYMTGEPIATQTLVPSVFSQAIALMLAAWEITSEEKYLQRADYFGRRAVRIFFTKESPLPKVTSIHDHYETITGGDDLMLVFHELGRALSKTEHKAK